jgi:hypothetical protein
VNERFMKFVSPEPNSGCWLWTGCLNSKGYGRFSFGGVVQNAHRVAYQLFRGSIPESLHIDHLCRVRCCVNPDHLEPVTPLDNTRRGDAGKWGKAKRNCPSGHEYTPANTYRRKDGWRECRACWSVRRAAKREAA